jgi:hypothetical protein
VYLFVGKSGKESAASASIFYSCRSHQGEDKRGKIEQQKNARGAHCVPFVRWIGDGNKVRGEKYESKAEDPWRVEGGG